MYTDPARDPIAIALAEDLGPGDVTGEFFLPADHRSRALMVARESAVLAGIETAAEVFRRVDPATEVRVARADGDTVGPGETVLEAAGRTRSLLSAERVALNFVQRLSGVATLTRRFVEAAGGRATILDTRKTTPGLRALEKAAVRAGGGRNHRFGLHDMVLVKDNHLAANPDPAALQDAIDRARAARPGIAIEIEADTLDQVRRFLALRGVDRLLLDNMTPEQMREAVALGRGQVAFEASGGVNLHTVAAIAATGVDFISVGALTHSAPAIDFALELSDASA